MPQCNENSRQLEQLRFLTDRMALLMVICKSRTADWNPWFRENLYTGDTAEEMRDWPDYKVAKSIIGHMLRRNDNENNQSERLLRGGEEHAE